MWSLGGGLQSCCKVVPDTDTGLPHLGTGNEATLQLLHPSLRPSVKGPQLAACRRGFGWSEWYSASCLAVLIIVLHPQNNDAHPEVSSTSLVC